MALTYDDVVTLVKAEVVMGSVQDTNIGNKIKQAVRLAEKKLDLPYMRIVTGLALSEGDTSFALTSLNADVNLIKKVNTVRFESEDGLYSYAKKVEYLDLSETDADDVVPSGFWIEGLSTAHFDREIYQAYTTDTCKVFSIQFTDRATLTGAATHWLFENAEQWVVAQTLVNLAPTMREPDLMKMYQFQAQTEWDEVCRFVEEWDWENTTTYMNPDRSKASV